MYNSTIYDFLKINRKRTNRTLGWWAVCFMFLTLTTTSVKAQNTGTIQIGSGETNTSYSSETIPITNYSYSYSQQIVTATEFATNEGVAGNISKIRWMFPNIGNNPSVYGDWDIWIGHTTKTEFTSNADWVSISTLTKVFSGNIHTLPLPPINNKWFEIEFSTPFTYNGTDNIVVAVHEKTQGYSSTSLSIRVYNSTPNSGIVYRNDNTNPNPSSPPTANVRVAILPQLQFVGQLVSCPSVTNLTLTNPTFTSVDVSWNPQGTETSWNIEWGTLGFIPGTGSEIGSATSNSQNYTINGLIPDTNYQIYVRADCGNGDNSFWKSDSFFSGYCMPSTNNTVSYTSTFSTTHAITNVNYIGTQSGYINNSSHLIVQNVGLDFNFSHTLSNNSSTVRIWVDWNNNSQFEDSEEVYFGTTNLYPNILKGTIMIPDNTQTGNYRLRLRSQWGVVMIPGACTEQVSGTTLDYTLSVIAPPSCMPVTNIYTANATTTSVDVLWNSQGTETSWDIEWGTPGFTPDIGNHTGSQTVSSSNVSITGLTAKTNYDIYIRADCGAGNKSAWRSISFFSGYCTPNSSSFSYTSDFSTTGALVNINYSIGASPTGSYQNVSNTHVITHIAGSVFDFSHAFYPIVFTNNLRIWVDWNNDLQFENSEEVYWGYVGTDPYIQTGTITIPPNTPIGNYRMRLRSSLQSDPNFSACEWQQYGSTVDFTLSVVNTYSCLPVTNLSITANYFNIANVSWTAGDTETSWDIEWGTPGFSPGTGTEIGSANVSSTNYTITSLTADTNYQIFVRAGCGNDDFSVWNSILFFSGYCNSSETIGDPGIDHTSEFSTSGASTNITYIGSQTGYIDNSSQTIIQNAGISFDFSHTYFSQSGGSNTIRIWIDWNNDLVFDDTEEVFIGYVNTTPLIQNGTIDIPINTQVGNYRMRLRSKTYGGTPSACSAEILGTTIDYTLSILPALSCMPVTNLTFTQTSITSATLSWTSTGNLFDVEWGEAGFTLGNGTQINGLTTNYVSVTTQSDTTYQFYVRNDCGGENFSIWRGPFEFKTGFCTSSLHTEPYNCDIGSKIFNFEIMNAMENLINFVDLSCSIDGYIDYTYMSVSASEIHTPSFVVDVYNVISEGSGIKLWIDWNKNGVFEVNELIAETNSTIYNASFTGIINIPQGTPLGDYKLRVRTVDYTTYFDACYSADYGQTQDYTFTVVAPPSCLPPTNLTFTQISKTNALLGWTSDGDSFDLEWGEIGFTLGNGTQMNGLTTNSIQVNTEESTLYQFYVRKSCGGGDYSTWNGPINFKTEYYCIPISATGCYPNLMKIVNFQINDAIINIANYSGNICENEGYSNYTSISATVSEENNPTFFVQLNDDLSPHIKIWIDWNSNDAFENNELIAQSTTNSWEFSYTFIGNINIPQNTPPGDYKLRVRVVRNNYNFTACSSFEIGEIEDYTFRVVAPQTCLPPTNLSALTYSSTNTTLSWVSDGNLFDVEWGEEGFVLGNGTQINGIMTNIINIDTNINTLYQFYVRRNCGNNDFSIWNGPFNFYKGYCIPKTSNNVEYSFLTNNALIDINYSASSQPNIEYENATSTHIITQIAGQNFDFEHSFAKNIRIWIDWNNDLIFNDSEEVYWGFIDSIPYVHNGTIVIPANMPIGNYRMRVRVSWYNNPSISACDPETYGSTVDFTLSVIAPPTCFPVSIPITATNSSATSVLLQWISDGNLFDIEYGEAGFTQGSGTMITEVSNNYILSGLTAGNNYQYYVRQNCGNGDESLWRGPVSFTAGNYTEKISSLLNTDPQITDVACGTTFNIDVPAGKQIASLKVEYAMVSASPRFISEQRSVLYSSTLNAGENAVISGNISDNFPGIQNYNRFVDFANGATGTVEFELKTWRVAGNTDCTDDEIFVEAGTWILTPTFEDLPACPNPPTDLGYNVISESSVELFWTEGESGATHQLKYGNVGFDVNTAGTTEDNLTTNTFMLSGLDPFVAQEFYVRKDCGAGDFSDWAGPFRFNSGYCLPYSSITYYFTAFSTTNAVENVSYTFSTSIPGGYVNNTALIIEQEAGESFDFSSNYIGGASGLRIWIDWNNDLVFDDTEQVFYLGNNSGNKSGTIDIPQNTPIGDYRMRVRVEQGASSIPPACGVIGFGEAMDFVLRVACPTIAPPTGETEQTFTAGQTIADLVVNGDNLVWYSDNTYSLTLSQSEELVDGTTYYVVSKIGNCQSDPLIIIVTQVVSRTDFDLYGFSYYPNPVNDVLYFSSNLPIEKIVISNILGQQISANLNSDNTILDMSNLPSGNYFVKVTIEGISKTIKVIKN